MNYGLTIPNFGDFGDPVRLVELAEAAETGGWDGFFLWDHMRDWRGGGPVVDPWVAMAAIAQATERIRIGPMVTPVSRRRPTKLARETVTLDHLSGGRLAFGAGLGAPADLDFADLGEVHDDRERAALLDEGLDLLAALWSGGEVDHDGRFRVKGAAFLPRPVQQPRIPVWIAGFWPNRPPFRRAARWDGVFPIKIDRDTGRFAEFTPADAVDVLTYVAEHRTSAQPFDLIVAGPMPDDGEEAADHIGPLGEVGVTWYVHDLGFERRSLGEWQEHILAGPPQVLR